MASKHLAVYTVLLAIIAVVVVAVAGYCIYTGVAGALSDAQGVVEEYVSTEEALLMANDLNGDGADDEVQTKLGDDGTVSVLLNDESCGSFTACDRAAKSGAQRIGSNNANGMPMLLLTTESASGTYGTAMFVVYTTHGYELAYDFTANVLAGARSVAASTSDGTHITLDADVKSLVGTLTVRFTLTRSGDTVTLDSQTGTVVKVDGEEGASVKLAKKTAFYQDAGSSIVAFTAKKKSKVTPERLYCNGEYLWLGCRNADGKLGWIEL